MEKKKRFITCDGNYAAAHIAYMFSEVSAIYPITPSSPMAEYIDEWAANGRENIFKQTVEISELQSEGGAAGALHGSLQCGALTSSYTASQGLLLMIPNMYKIAGELLPCVLHVTARSIAAQALSIFGDHSDVMSVRMTGFAMLATGSVQEIMDLAAVAHLATIKSRVPFLHFFDGFRTSHEIQKVEYYENEDLAPLLDMDAVKKFKEGALNPDSPDTRGTAQNPDIYFQTRELSNSFYKQVPEVVEYYMGEITKLCGREYHLFDYYGDPNAEQIIIAMGSVTETIKEVVDFKMRDGEKVGVVAVHLYRPFSPMHLLKAIPKSVKCIAVLDRTKEPGAIGEPLYQDVINVFYDRPERPLILGGRYGLSSKDTTPAQIVAVFANLSQQNPKNHFTLGIVDDVTFLSLPIEEEISVTPPGTFEGKFWGIGSDGTVGANKNSIKIIGGGTNKYAQAYFSYDSKKSGGVTISHLRFGDNPIKSPYLVHSPNFVACHVPSYLGKYDLLKGLKKGGIFLLNSIWEKHEVSEHLPNSIKIYLAENEIKFYIINATKIAKNIGLGNRTNTIMQSAFFRIADIIPHEKAMLMMKKAIDKTFGIKGEEVVNMNYAAVDQGSDYVERMDVPDEWRNLVPTKTIAMDSELPDFVKNVAIPMNAQQGDELPVSAFLGMEYGSFPAGTTAYEKRGVADAIPEWQPHNCIQCNQCAFVCPHAAIRPWMLDEAEKMNAPETLETLPIRGKGYESLTFRLQVSPLDCTGCGNCVDVCPAKEKALELRDLETQGVEEIHWNYVSEQVSYKEHLAEKSKSVKNLQFAQPLFEFSGACAGCGETPYVKAITQLFGERMIVANATGCSSIYSGSAPSTPYCKHKESGKGPAWANSLFEDNAEFGLGMAIGIKAQRNHLANIIRKAMKSEKSEALQAAFQYWLENMNDGSLSVEASIKILNLLKENNAPYTEEILSHKQYLIKKSNWIIGGDGWAYDIGYGGLDHVLASGEDCNILVLDTEVYSNTGGQASKSTPVGAVAKFASSGKKTRKKDLGVMAMTYGYVYVAQVAIGANQAQFLKAVREAESYPGPSLIIAYSPCIAHGIRAGMGRTQAEGKRAVETGYWHLYRFNPLLEGHGKNPFLLDSKEPHWESFQDFLRGEQRYTTLSKMFPEEAKQLFLEAENNAKWRYYSYQRMASMNYSSN